MTRSERHARAKINLLQLGQYLNSVSEACRVTGEYLLIEDTTSLSFTRRGEVAGMGPLTSEGSQGLLARTCLAARIEHWSAAEEPEVTLAGVFGQECWAREKPQGTRAERKKAKRKKTGPCESERWGRAILQAPPAARGAYNPRGKGRAAIFRMDQRHVANRDCADGGLPRSKTRWTAGVAQYLARYDSTHAYDRRLSACNRTRKLWAMTRVQLGNEPESAGKAHQFALRLFLSSFFYL